MFTFETIARFLAKEPSDHYRIDRLQDAGDALWLGQFALCTNVPGFRFGYSFELSDSGRLYLLDLPASERSAITGVAAIYRQFDRSRYQDEPSEYFAGWVPPEERESLREWCRTLNALTDQMLARKHQDREGLSACPECSGERYGPGEDARRTPSGSRYRLDATLRCEGCGHTASWQVDLDYATDPTAPGHPLLR